jgi:hypothetical protein
VWTGRYIPMFRRNIGLLFLPSMVKMKALCSSETLVSTYKSIQRYNPETNIDIFTSKRTSDLMVILLISPLVNKFFSALDSILLLDVYLMLT